MKRLQRFRSSSGRPVPHPSRAELRLQKDLEELCFSRFSAGNTGVRISFPRGREAGNKLRFVCTISPQEGTYRGGCFCFQFVVPSSYPFAAPSVTCQTKVLHPNINWRTGAVGLALLTSDWKPVLSINTVIFGLQLLFLEPDLEHALHADMARLMQTAPSRFHEMVRQTMRGGMFWGVTWPPLLSGGETPRATPTSNGVSCPGEGHSCKKRERHAGSATGANMTGAAAVLPVASAVLAGLRAAPSVKRPRKTCVSRLKRLRSGGNRLYERHPLHMASASPPTADVRSSLPASAGLPQGAFHSVAESGDSVGVFVAPSPEHHSSSGSSGTARVLNDVGAAGASAAVVSTSHDASSPYKRTFGRPSVFQLQLLASSFPKLPEKHKSSWPLPAHFHTSAPDEAKTEAFSSDDAFEETEMSDGWEECKQLAVTAEAQHKSGSSGPFTAGLRSETNTPLPGIDPSLGAELNDSDEDAALPLDEEEEEEDDSMATPVRRVGRVSLAYEHILPHFAFASPKVS